MSSFVTHLSCPRCGTTCDASVPHNLCACGSPLLVEYDLAGIKEAVDKEDVAARAPSMWRYAEFLPLEDPEHVVSLGEGVTPLLHVEGFGFSHLYVKDEGLNPTGSLKARGASAGISRARELGIKDVALASAGNAGGAWACYATAAGIPIHVVIPTDAPAISTLECEMYGADMQIADDAGALIARGVAEHGWFDASTLNEPYRLEGKKTLGLEIAEQLGWTMPDAIVCPAGDGVGLIGIWRALLQLKELGWVEGHLPELIAVQAKGCAPLVRAWDRREKETEFWENAETIASELRVPKPRGDLLVLRAIEETKGIAVAVSDDAMRRCMTDLARVGIPASPEGAATLAAAQLLRQRGELYPEDRVVLINTGTALKHPDIIRQTL